MGKSAEGKTRSRDAANRGISNSFSLQLLSARLSVLLSQTWNDNLLILKMVMLETLSVMIWESFFSGSSWTNESSSSIQDNEEDSISKAKIWRKTGSCWSQESSEGREDCSSSRIYSPDWTYATFPLHLLWMVVVKEFYRSKCFIHSFSQVALCSYWEYTSWFSIRCGMLINVYVRSNHGVLVATWSDFHVNLKHLNHLPLRFES